ncbi:hypothetical protein D3C81_1900340 [compost metagenome]
MSDVARFLPRLANDQIEEFTRYINHFTYGNAIKIFCYQMLLASTLTNLLFGGVDWNGDFATYFTVHLHHNQR